MHMTGRRCMFLGDRFVIYRGKNARYIEQYSNAQQNSKKRAMTACPLVKCDNSALMHNRY
jgi:hypothetical protein